MTDANVTLERASDSRTPYVERLLEENDLPSDDVRSNPDCFYVGYAGTDPVGVCGLERYGTDGLLRSVAVERSARGNGFGTALCDALEARARADGVETLYLLTTTATEFFGSRGYVEIERSEVPDEIRRTTQFEDLCPTTATCMRTSLEGDHQNDSYGLL